MEIKKNHEIGVRYDPTIGAIGGSNDNEGLAEWGIDNGYAGVLDEDYQQPQSLVRTSWKENYDWPSINRMP